MPNVLRFISVIAGIALAALTGCSGAPMPPSPAAGPMRVIPAASLPQTIPFFRSSFQFGGKTFPYAVVGSNPLSPQSTTIGTQIIPLNLKFANGTILSGGAIASDIAASPVFRTGTYAAGVTQYGDAVMRSEFWKFVATKNYHVLLSAPVIERTASLSVPSTAGSTQKAANGSISGLLTYAYFIQTVQPALVKSYGISPSTLTIFATKDIRVLEPSGHCCFNGYHSSFTVATSSGTGTFTTVWGLVPSATPTQMFHVSHEIAEWLNDPFYPSHPNVVPRWVHPLTGTCDSDLLEVGDPLVTVNFTVNGDSVQDEAFFSWFSRTTPSTGIGGRYDFLGRLTKPAAVC